MAGPGTLIGGVVAVGVGEAASTALDPVLEPQRQAAWEKSLAKVFDLGTVAQLVAQGLLSIEAAVTEGGKNGYAPSRVRRAVQLAMTAAPVAELLELWRRDKISEALVDHGLAKASIEPQYWKPIKELFYGRLDPAIIATAIQRGIMADPGFLPVGPPTATGKVRAFPTSPLDPIEEAKASGIDAQRLFVETAIVGLPLSLQEAASAYFRGIIELADFERAVSEGNTRNEWGPAALAQARHILTAGEYVERQLRGFTDRAGRLLDTDKLGMSHEDSDKLYQVLGRAPGVHLVVQGLARGGKYPGSYANVPEPFRSALQRANIREEWAEIEYAARFTYPSAFVLRSLAQAGDLGDAAAVEQILKEIGWKPSLAAEVSLKWAPTSTSSDPHTTKAQNQLWTTTHRSYIAQESDDVAATSALNLLGIPATSQTDILALWQHERSLVRAQLSPADIRKAEQQGDINAATGVAWTRADALAAMLARGWSDTEANDYLNIPYKG